jgi:hypothetical protein
MSLPQRDLCEGFLVHLATPKEAQLPNPKEEALSPFERLMPLGRTLRPS